MLSVSAFFFAYTEKIQSVLFDGIKKAVFDRAKFDKTTLGDFPQYGLFLSKRRCCPMFSILKGRRCRKIVDGEEIRRRAHRTGPA